MKLRLVDDWKRFWKWASVQLAVLNVLAIQLYEQIPQFQTYIPDKLFHNVMTALVALIVLGRVMKFEGNNADPK